MIDRSWGFQHGCLDWSPREQSLEEGPCNSDESVLEHIKALLERVIGLAAWTYAFLVACSKMCALRWWSDIINCRHINVFMTLKNMFYHRCLSSLLGCSRVTFLLPCAFLVSECEGVGESDSLALWAADIGFLNMVVEASAPFMVKPWRQAVLTAESALHLLQVPMDFSRSAFQAAGQKWGLEAPRQLSCPVNFLSGKWGLGVWTQRPAKQLWAPCERKTFLGSFLKMW